MFIPGNQVCVARNPNQLSLSSAWLAPLNLGSLNSAHIRGIDVQVEESSIFSSQANVLRLYCFGALAP